MNHLAYHTVTQRILLLLTTITMSADPDFSITDHRRCPIDAGETILLYHCIMYLL